MNKYIYDRVEITLVDELAHYQCVMIANIDDYDHEIEIETIAPIEIKRGWVGDLIFNFKGFAVESNEEAFTTITLNNVLCARIKTNVEAGEAVMWKYTFLKD